KLNLFHLPKLAAAHRATIQVAPSIRRVRDAAVNGWCQSGSRFFAPLLHNSILPVRKERPLREIPPANSAQRLALVQFFPSVPPKTLASKDPRAHVLFPNSFAD